MDDLANAGPSTPTQIPLRFEKFSEHHLPAVLEIERYSNTSPWSERSFRHEFDHDNSIFLVGISRAEVIAYGGVWLVVDEAHVTTIAVHQDWRRKGVGRRLFVELLERSVARGAICSTLEVRAGNEAAIRMYLSFGYKIAATRRSYYPDNREDAVVMWLHDMSQFATQ